MKAIELLIAAMGTCAAKATRSDVRTCDECDAPASVAWAVTSPALSEIASALLGKHVIVLWFCARCDALVERRLLSTGVECVDAPTTTKTKVTA